MSATLDANIGATMDARADARRDARTDAAPITAAHAASTRWDLLRVALVASVLTSVWRLQDLVPALAPLRLSTVSLLALVAFMLVSPREQHHAALMSRSLVMRGLFAVAFLAALSVPTSIYFGLSARFFALNVLPAVLIAVTAAAALKGLKDARRMAALQVGGAMLYSSVILTRFEIGEEGRLGHLIHYDANDIAMLMVCTLPLALYFVGHASTIGRRLVGMAAAGLFLAMIVKSGSRGAFLALILVGLYLFLRSTTVAWRHRVTALVAIVVMFVAASGSQYWSNVSTLLDLKSDYNWIGNTESGRMSVWARGITYMLDHPLTGVGVAAFPIAEGTISPLAERQRFGGGLKWSAAHSSYIQIGAELGVLGLIVFISTLLGALFAAGRLARDAARRRAPDISALARALAASMIGYIVASAFLSQAYAPFLFLTIGLVVGLDVSMRRKWRLRAPA